MTFISDSLNKIKPSATMVITAKATQLKREGKNVIGLSSGEPDFDTPQHVKQAAIDAINNGHTKYTNIEGIPELRQSIVEKFKKDNDLSYDISNVIVGTVGKQILRLFTQCFDQCGMGMTQSVHRDTCAQVKKTAPISFDEPTALSLYETHRRT